MYPCRGTHAVKLELIPFLLFPIFLSYIYYIVNFQQSIYRESAIFQIRSEFCKIKFKIQYYSTTIDSQKDLNDVRIEIFYIFLFYIYTHVYHVYFRRD